jgi:hypothetical protein
MPYRKVASSTPATMRLLVARSILSSQVLFIAFLVPVMHAQESAPEWSRKTFSAPSERVFDAALKTITAQRYKLDSKNEDAKVVRFIVGRSAFSWGYVMVLKITPGESNTSNVSVEVDRMRGPDGKVSIVASGKKEVQKVFQGMEKELAKAPSAETR